MDSIWFKEERTLPKNEQKEEIIKTKEVILNSTIVRKRLGRILEEKIEETYRSEEDFSKPDWQLNAIANASRRKTLREIQKIIIFK